VKWFANKITIIALIIISCNIESAIAQTPLFKKLEVLPKISETDILLVEQDSLGFLWLGSNKGLFRFDGVASRELNIPDSLKLFNTTAIHIHAEKVYYGFDNGCVVIVNTKNLKDIQVESFSESSITSITTDGNRIWVGTNGAGITLLENGKKNIFNTSNGLADDYVHSLEFISHHLAVATDLGLSLCRYEYEKFTSINFSITEGLTDNLVTTLQANGSENLLLGMQNGTVCNINIQNKRVDPFPGFNNLGFSTVIKILNLNEEILVITEQHGAFILNWHDRSQIQQFQLEEEGNNPRKPNDAIVDSEGNLLICYGDNNIKVADFRLQFITQHDGQSFADAYCVMSDHQGNIWFANKFGIFRHEGEFASDQLIEQFYVAPPNQNNIVSLCEDSKHNIWFGTFGNGIGQIDLNSKRTTFYTEKNGLVNDNVLSITNRGDQVWLATLGGVCSISYAENKPVFKTYDSSSGLGTSFVYCVYTDHLGRLWFGTDGKGLVLFEDDNFFFINSKFPNSGKSVTSITEDEHGNIWFVSTDKGLQMSNLDTLTDIPLNTAKEKVEIFSIQHDPFGNIIALTSAGIAVLSSHTDHISFIQTGLDLQANYLNVAALDIKGRMWLATKEAMIRYNDFSMGRKIKPRTYIESMEVLLLPVDTSIHYFDHQQNHFVFNLTSIWLQDPEDVIYQYQLMGYDVDWITTRDRKVIFSQLPSGKYTFRIRASVDENWESATIVSYQFEIGKPFFLTLWFYAIIIIVFIALLFVIIRIRLNRIRRLEMAAREKVQSQFDTLRNQVNPHFLFNSFNTLNSIIAQDQEAAIAYVEKLSDYFRIVLEQREKDVITVKEELSLVNSYLYLQQQRFGDNLNCEINLSSETGRSLIPPLTIQLLVENAIKHNVISKSKPLHIKIFELGNEIIISNNVQLKLTKEPSTGIGLENIKHRYRILFDRTISIVDSNYEFAINLPIVENKDFSRLN